ncbi:hypothetical protein GTA08_BOTSDO02751 [Neofusicoccum parvum]|uniref:Prenylated rab acceptor 1 protein n=3 Tax=Neofusicoccum TaxID=407951 RepID=R1GGX7_BOTPV|nr:hypothetical protein UCRNP2_8065 [Neofusicoccum parvum UCRNP2]GME24661.1 hypothetical protein GTA08_BOTSDO02751 [Neofusicoccum parvum]GME51866.1 hypothetical protein GTA08_BOTSDO02751 [Neofusicoccum parvum]
MIVSRPRGIARKHRRNDYLHVPLSRHTPSDLRTTSSTLYHYPTTRRVHSAPTMGWFGPSRSPYSSSGGYYSKPSWGRANSTYSSHSHSSYYKRRPRDGYINRLLYKIKQLLRELYIYARRHPMKLFFMVVMPLLSSGALHGVLRQFGVSLPRALNSALGGSYDSYGSRSFSGGYYGSSGYGNDYGRGSEGLNLGSLMSLASLAKHFV